MNRTPFFLLPLLALGCNKDDDATETGLIDTEDTQPDSDSGMEETGDTDTDTDTEEPCLAEVLEITPEDGEDDVFYRDALTVAFTEDASQAVFALTNDTSGEVVSTTTSWGTGNLMATLTPGVPLQGSTVYTLTASICEVTSHASFETSAYGQPIEGGNETLTGKTSVLLFENVNFTQPENIGSILSLYFDVPLLVGVLGADSAEIDVVAALGYFDNVAGYKQRMNEPTWTFGQVSLDESAYFTGAVSELDLGYGNVSIPVYNFGLSGTFSPDASHFAGGTLSGKVDTRHMAPLLGETDENAACELVGALGVSCEPCPDGEEFCLTIFGEEIVSEEVPGVTLVEVAE